jgi:hypothetical protein
LKGEIINILTQLSLEWEEPCQKFHDTHRSIKTASAGQVKEKIYTTSMKKYEKYKFFIKEINNLSKLI